MSYGVTLVIAQAVAKTNCAQTQYISCMKTHNEDLAFSQACQEDSYHRCR